MRISHFKNLQPIAPVRAGFRSGSIQFHDLMAGTEDTPENYGLQLVDVHDRYSTPQHRHNFEQVRVMLEGEFGFGAGQVQRKGSVGYFCEGTYYTQAGDGRSTTLLLQIGGPSGQGFMSRGQLRLGIEALAARGSFADGVFSWQDATGKKHNQDSYEAVWEYVHGTPVVYPKPQYHGPVLLEPDRFDWLPLAPGVEQRDLGCFNGRGLRLAQWRMEAGASLTADSAAQAVLLFCVDGAGSAGTDRWWRWTSLEIARGERVELKAEAGSSWFVVGLPRFRRGGSGTG